jgi:hypothetical protein
MVHLGYFQIALPRSLSTGKRRCASGVPRSASGTLGRSDRGPKPLVRSP